MKQVLLTFVAFLDAIRNAVATYAGNSPEAAAQPSAPVVQEEKPKRGRPKSPDKVEPEPEPVVPSTVEEPTGSLPYEEVKALCNPIIALGAGSDAYKWLQACLLKHGANPGIKTLPPNNAAFVAEVREYLATM